MTAGPVGFKFPRFPSGSDRVPDQLPGGEPDAAQPLRESKVASLSEAICNFVRTLQRFGDVKIVTHGTRGWYEKSSAVLLPEARTLLDSLPAR